MVRIKIGESERELDNADAQWVNEQVRGYQRTHGTLPCVRVTVDEDQAHINLITMNCPRSGGGGGVPQWRPAEAEVLELWKRHHLDAPAWAHGNLLAFVQQLRRLF